MKIEALKLYATQLAEEVLAQYPADFEQSDAIHEQCDGSELVIYYGKAWETVDTIHRADSLLMGRAEEMREEFFRRSRFSSIDEIMTQLAYCILTLLVTDAIEEIQPTLIA